MAAAAPAPLSGGQAAGAGSFRALAAPPALPSGRVLAFCAADGAAGADAGSRDGVFVALVESDAEHSLRSLEVSATGAHWAEDVYTCGGKVCTSIGLLHHRAAGVKAADAVSVSFASDPPKEWVCMRVPGKGATPERVALSGDAIAACKVAPDAAECAVALSNGAVWLMCLATGKLIVKAPKIEKGGPAIVAAAAAGIGGRRVAVVRERPGGVLSFNVVRFPVVSADETPVAQMLFQGVFTGEGVPRGPLLSVHNASAGQEDRLLLCHGKGAGAAASFSTAILLPSGNAALVPLPHVPEAPAAWFTCGESLVCCARGEEGKSLVSAVDARFALEVSRAELPMVLPVGTKKTQQFAAAVSGGTAVVASTSAGSQLAAFRLGASRLPLQAMIGRGEAEAVAGAGCAAAENACLGPLREVAAGKRPRSAEVIAEVFGKKRKATEKALAEEVAQRKWPLTHDFVDLVAHSQCWPAAKELLALPELGEDHAVRLLAADADLQAGLLAAVVSRASTPGALEAALGDHLPPALLPAVLEALLEWMEAHQNFAPEAVEEKAPGLPTQAQVVRFASAVSDGCLPSLLRLDGDLLERVAEALLRSQRERSRVATLHAATRAAGQLGRAVPALGSGGATLAVEVTLLDF